MDFRQMARTFLCATQCAVTLAVASGVALGQAKLAEWGKYRAGARAGDEFGSAVSWLGDVDHDGVVDAVVAAMNEDDGMGGGDYFGAAYVFSGASGNLIRKHVGPVRGGRLGMQIAGGIDFDGDGTVDYLVGSGHLPKPTEEGMIFVYSGSSGALLHTFVGENPTDAFGSIRTIGDVTGDGVEDIGVGTSAFSLGPSMISCGRVYVYSGSGGPLLYTITGTSAEQAQGTICGIGDVDGDSLADILVGSHGWGAGPNGEGTADIYSGATGTFLYQLVGEVHGDSFGARACHLGDVNGDGFPDFMVDAQGHCVNAGDSVGRAYVYTGPTGQLLHTYDGTHKDEQLGILPVRGDIDLNDDGFADTLIGNSYWTKTASTDSSLFCYSGRTGRALYEFRGIVFKKSGEGLGTSLSAIGDFDHDGIDDVLVGAPSYSEVYPNEGRVYIFGGNDLFLQADDEEYKPLQSIVVNIRGGPPGMLGMIALVDVSGTPIFVPLLIGVLDANGELAISSTVPVGLSGLSCSFMGYAVKATGRGLADSISETITFK